jgi:hypothetical protein
MDHPYYYEALQGIIYAVFVFSLRFRRLYDSQKSETKIWQEYRHAP